MKRFHLHLHVDDLAKSVAFYSKLFAAEPARVEADYAKWMLDDPRVNFAVSTHGTGQGVDHLGFQAEDDAELADLKARARSADSSMLDEGETVCCYARSEKHWVTDPQGVAWEHYLTLDRAELYGESRPTAAQADAGACCVPAAPRGKPLSVPIKSTPACC